MASIGTKSSVLAIKVESVEGAPVPPAATTDYVALQDDFTMVPANDILENAELRASIGQAKSILGAENPTASLSHYIRHSGTEGVAPNYNDLLRAAFGAEAIASLEYDTAVSSTVSVLKVGASEADTFERGEALLIKDATNGFRIRSLMSASGTDLTLGFQVPVAPAAGVNLGKCVLYKPVNTGHPSLTLWHYIGNGGATHMMSGGKVTSMTVDITAGELINASYDIEGIKYFFNPIEITSSTRFLDFTDDDGTFAASVAVGFYNNPVELAEALTTAMNLASPGETHTVTYSDTTGRFRIISTGTVLSLLWNTGTNTANTIGTKLGFLVAADDTGIAAGTGYTSDNAMVLASPYTPALDAADPLAAKDNEVMIGDSIDFACFEASSVSLSISNERTVIDSVCSTSGRSGSLITARSVEVTVTALLNQYDVDKYYRFKTGADTRFQYSFGTKVGGQWVAGKCGALFLPTATVTSFEVTSEDNLATLNITLQGYVDANGNNEVFLGLV